MAASVVAYSASEYDTTLTLKWECLTCGVEGGWMPDSTSNYVAVQALAQRHNNDTHQGETNEHATI